jgi:hypothetical protein
MTKDHTESESVALTNYLSFVETFEEFFRYITGTQVEAPTIYQDSTSVTFLVTQGGGVVRTKHLRVHMNLAKDTVVENRSHIVYLHTSKMIADGLTKPLERKDVITYSEPY